MLLQAGVQGWEGWEPPQAQEYTQKNENWLKKNNSAISPHCLICGRCSTDVSLTLPIPRIRPLHPRSHASPPPYKNHSPLFIYTLYYRGRWLRLPWVSVEEPGGAQEVAGHCPTG